VHRDIKPENILLHEGQALVADFGIALAVSRSEGGSRMTETGMSLGTPHYMAPEQAMGEREITPKADIYALGAVLYEMLTGDPPFTGSTAQAIVARTLTESPRPITKQRHTVSAHIEAAVFMALEKLPADRFASAGDFAAALDNPDLMRGTAAAIASGATLGRADWRTKAAIPLASLAALATVAFVVAMSRPRVPAPLTRYALAFAAEQAPLADRPIEISPDGSQFAFVGPADPGISLWIKRRDRANAAPVPGTLSVTRAAFSPDGQWLAYVQTDQQLKKVPLAGGAALTLGDSAMPARGLAWMDDGTVVYLRSPNEMRKRPDIGGAATTVWKGDTATAWNPTPLPGSRGVLFSRCGPAGCTAQRDLWVADLRSGKPHFVVAGALMGRYVTTGHIVYIRPDGAMLAIAFDPKSLKTHGTPVPIRDSIALALNNVPTFAVSDEGTFITRSGSSLAAAEWYQMVWVDRTGRETIIDSTWTLHLTGYAGNSGWSLSPDGGRLAIGLNTEAGDQIWVKQLPQGPLMRISFDSVRNYRPRWMPDGRTVMFVSTRTAAATLARLFKRPADGTGADELVFGEKRSIQEGAWAPDGKTLLIRTGGTVSLAGNRDISVVRPGLDSTPRPVVATAEFDESAIALSPDGRWLAYESNESGHTEVFIRPFPNAAGGRWQVSTSGGRAPLWAKSGRELFYVNEARDMVVVPIAPGVSPGIGVRKILFHLRDEIYLANQENYTPFDISPDGQRFIMAKRIRATAAQVAPLVVTESWFQELRQRMAKR
jgi:hypothetical protein